MRDRGLPLVRIRISGVVSCRSAPWLIGGAFAECSAFLKALWQYGWDGESLSFVGEDEVYAVAVAGHVVLKSG